MAIWQISTKITTVKTNLSCTVMLCYVSDGSEHGSSLWWQRIAGRYRFGPKSGHWGYWNTGILLVRTNHTGNPLFQLPANAMLALDGLAMGFPDKVIPGSTIKGFGSHLLTGEELTYLMSFPPPIGKITY